MVELAVDPDGRRVATKRVALTGSHTQMGVARRRLRREAEILGRLAHPGIVPLLDVVDDGGELVLVFPALAENLEDRVGRLGPLPPGEVTRIGRALIEALAVAHRHGVVHRDIKPANILFDDAGRPALGDFGVAVTGEITAGLTEAGAAIGTPTWMAPEQARGEPAGTASDVFCLAATLVYAATGEGPYRPGPASAVIGRAARNKVRPLPLSVPDTLRAPLARMLDPRPARRPSAAGVLGGLDGTAVARPARPRRASWAGPARRGLSRLLGDPAPQARGSRRNLIVGAAAVVATAVVTLVVALGLSGGGPRPAPVASPAPAATCSPRPYLPCGTSVPAPHTNGTTCDPGWYNLDGTAADGCEAHSDYTPGTALTASAPVHANLVPPAASDSFVTHVKGNALNLCWGSLHVRLTSPPRTAEAVTVWRGTTKVASAVSADGTPATATVGKPSCFGADSEDLRVTVSTVAASDGASGRDFTLTRDGGW